MLGLPECAIRNSSAKEDLNHAITFCVRRMAR